MTAGDIGTGRHAEIERRGRRRRRGGREKKKKTARYTEGQKTDA